MAFFQSTVIDKHLKATNKQQIQSAYLKFKEHFHNPTVQGNIRNSKEEQYQEGFFRDLFVSILGYTLNPNTDFNLTTEYKNIKDSKKADGAIVIANKVHAVIELKGTETTDLGKVETQAFGYKNNQPDCVYVIISNFEKLRFYIDNAIDFIEFNLFTLSLEQFELLYLCLSFESIANGVPKKLKNDSISEEDTITKKLYKDYSLFKRELHQNLVQLNPQFDEVSLFKKSQKLLDRFLFLLFAEDRQLLPPNSVRLILQQWKQLKDLDEDIPLYNRFKKYFGYLNTGHKGQKHDVFAYNGGLFKPDEILDNVIMDDDLLYKHTYKLSEYDFESEVDVNILGHIFENSLNELDEIKAQLQGLEVDKTKSKRKKDGVFYTPKYITKYIVENTIGKLCTEKKAELEIVEEDYTTDNRIQKRTKQGLVDKITAYREWLLHLTICDPACGSGAFLNQALDYLINEHKYIDELQAKLFGDSMILSDVDKSILENNLFGVDLNEESVEIAKLSLWLRTARPNRKLNDLNNNIKCGNSLIDDPTIAGDKAFNWHNEFPQIFEKGGFDVIIGNPPYVRMTQLNNEIKNYIESNFYSAFKQYDLYVLFNELALKINKTMGYIGFIQPNKFLSADYGYKILNLLKHNTKINSIYNVSLDKVFSEASVYPYIFIFKKVSFTKPFKEENINLFELCNSDNLIGFGEFAKINSIIQKLNHQSILLGTLTSIIKRGLPNTKISFNENGLYFGVKSTLLEYSFYQPCPDVKFDYLSSIDEKSKTIEFSKELILLPRTVLKLRAILKQTQHHILDRVYYFEINNHLFSNKFILCLLNSNISTFYYNFIYGSTKIGGGYIDLKGSQIENFIIPNIPRESQQPFIEKADQMIVLNKEFQEVLQRFNRAMQRKFELPELSNKLQNWHTLTFKDFIAELGKKKIKLTLSQEAEWEDYFLQEQQKALDLKSNIDSTDKEIDRMVYELYELTEDEIKVVEGY